MAFDGIFLRALCAELNRKLQGARIERVNQPSRGTIVFTLKAEQRMELLIGAGGGIPRAHLTTLKYEKPQEPPMFCMLLRKHLTGARVISIDQPELERVIRFRFNAPGTFGDFEERTVYAELFGRTANLVLTGSDGHVIDCLYRTGTLDTGRVLAPGIIYALPPSQGKRNITDSSAILTCDSNAQLDRLLVKTYTGISPLIARELCFDAYGDVSIPLYEAKARDSGNSIVAGLQALSKRVDSLDFAPFIVTQKTGVPLEFSYMPILQYGNGYSLERRGSFSELLDTYCGERDEQERKRQRTREITRRVRTVRDRTAKRLANQMEELKETENLDRLRECGDIITSNMHLMKKGDTFLRAEDYYNGGMCEIELDPLKTPQQNAAKYYKEYSRRKSAKLHLSELVKSGAEELDYLDSVLEELDRVESARDISEIQSELLETGIIANRSDSKSVRRKTQASGPLRFKSTGGYEIRVGRNNTQNDRLTLKSSSKTDLWLHAQKIHGSHVIISCAGSEPDENTIREAASLAAYYSKGRGAGRVPVDITRVKYVKKPSGAKPGMVIYTDYKTIAASPDKDLAEKLKI